MLAPGQLPEEPHPNPPLTKGRGQDFDSAVDGGRGQDFDSAVDGGREQDFDSAVDGGREQDFDFSLAEGRSTKENAENLQPPLTQDNPCD